MADSDDDEPKRLDGLKDLTRSRESLDILGDCQEEERVQRDRTSSYTSEKLKGGSSCGESDSDGDDDVSKPRMGALSRSRESLNILDDLEAEEGAKMNKLHRSVESLNLLGDVEAEAEAEEAAAGSGSDGAGTPKKMGKLYRSVESLNLLDDLAAEEEAGDPNKKKNKKKKKRAGDKSEVRRQEDFKAAAGGDSSKGVAPQFSSDEESGEEG